MCLINFLRQSRSNAESDREPSRGGGGGGRPGPGRGEPRAGGVLRSHHGVHGAGAGATVRDSPLRSRPGRAVAPGHCVPRRGAGRLRPDTRLLTPDRLGTATPRHLSPHTARGQSAGSLTSRPSLSCQLAIRPPSRGRRRGCRGTGSHSSGKAS